MKHLCKFVSVMSNEVLYAPIYSIEAIITYKMLPFKTQTTVIKHLRNWGILREKDGIKYVVTADLLKVLASTESNKVYKASSVTSNQFKEFDE